jgi:hypothetical protein
LFQEDIYTMEMDSSQIFSPPFPFTQSIVMPSHEGLIQSSIPSSDPKTFEQPSTERRLTNEIQQNDSSERSNGSVQIRTPSQIPYSFHLEEVSDVSLHHWIETEGESEPMKWYTNQLNREVQKWATKLQNYM